jgi:hypothetical protein
LKREGREGVLPPEVKQVSPCIMLMNTRNKEKDIMDKWKIT